MSSRTSHALGVKSRGADGVPTVDSSAAAADTPLADAFRVLPPPSAEAPVITPYLKYQTEMAWQEDDLRRKSWEGIRTEQDLLRTQKELRANLLAMLGGLPVHKTPLDPHITGKIQMEKLATVGDVGLDRSPA